MKSRIYKTPLTEPVDAIEVHPVCVVESKPFSKKEIVDVCEEKDAEFYSVYFHLKKGWLMCVADFSTKGQAEKYVVFLQSVINYFQKL